MKLRSLLLAAVLAGLTTPSAGAARHGAGDTGVVDVSNTPGMSEGEQPMGVNPANPLQITVAPNQWEPGAPPPASNIPIGNGLMNTAAYFSLDGGRTWHGGRLDQSGLGKLELPEEGEKAGFAPEFDDAAAVVNSDADTIWGRDGTGYYESGDIHGLHHHGEETGTVWRTHDGGRTWEPKDGIEAVKASQEPTPELDRPWFAIDNTRGRHAGRLYLTYETTPFGQVPPQVYLKYSDDHGATWSKTIRVDDGIYTTQYNPRQMPVVGAGGTLYDVYDRAPLTVSTEPTPQVSPIQLVVAASRDGGQTFSRVVVDDDVHRVQSPDEASAAYIEMISAIAADPKRKGRLAVAWPNAIDESSSRILLRSSANGGKTWSKRIDVADDPIVKDKPNQHDHVASTWLADGRLVVSWRDRRSTGGTWADKFRLFARTLDPDPRGGLHPGRRVEFTDKPQAPSTNYRGPLMPDEFDGMDWSRLGVMVTWAEMRGDWPDVAFRRIPLRAFDTAQLRRAGGRCSFRLDVATPEKLRVARVYAAGGNTQTLRGRALARSFRIRGSSVRALVLTRAGTRLPTRPVSARGCGG